MATYVICKNRQGRKIDLAVCLTNCKEQFECDNFNEVVNKARTGQTEKPAEEKELQPNAPQVQEESDDTDVTREIPSVPMAVPSGGKAEQLYDQVLSLKAEIEVRWFELGKILKEIKEGRHYIDLGCSTWKDFCEMVRGKLELSWRAVDYLIATTLKCEEIGIKKEVAGQIGWSKLKEIVPVVTKKNKDHWINIARGKETTVQVLNAKVRVARGKITEEESKVLAEKMFFSLFKDQKDNVERALELAARMTDSDSRGFQLEMICADFRGTYESEDREFSKKKIISNLLSRLEAVLRIKIGGEIVDLETGEILVESEAGGPKE